MPNASVDLFLEDTPLNPHQSSYSQNVTNEIISSFDPGGLVDNSVCDIMLAQLNDAFQAESTFLTDQFY